MCWTEGEVKLHHGSRGLSPFPIDPSWVLQSCPKQRPRNNLCTCSEAVTGLWVPLRSGHNFGGSGPFSQGPC